MKLRKNVNYNTLITKFKEQIEQTNGLIGDFQKVMSLLEDTKLGINEVNYRMEEELTRYRNTCGKIEELIGSF